ncbi:MAG: thioredoxin [Candidatus Marinimicrobia bacterium]|nr:thioredoxin [Candidatus Neomarinimicrobiota bacterium]
MLEFTSANFEEEVLKSDLPVVVDLWAQWCQPCLKLGPIVEEVAKQYTGRVKFGKINIDVHQDVAVKYGVMSIPTLLYFKNGEVAHKTVGLIPEKKLIEAIEKVL